MNDAVFMQVGYGGGQLGHVKSHNVFGKGAQSLQVDLKADDKRRGAGKLKLRDVQRRSPPNMRSSTKKQFSSSWNAYRMFTTKAWSI